MNHNQLRYHPFSWENSAGISKASSLIHNEDIHALKLPPPPGPSHSPYRKLGNGLPGILVPLPPCPFQPPPRVMTREGDPFLAAYKECTKSVKKEGMKMMKKKKWLLGRLSCKRETWVREDGIAKVSQVASIVNGRDRWLLERSRSQGDDDKGSNFVKGHQRQKSLVL